MTRALAVAFMLGGLTFSAWPFWPWIHQELNAWDWHRPNLCLVLSPSQQRQCVYRPIADRCPTVIAGDDGSCNQAG